MWLQVEIFCYALSASDSSEWRQRIEMEAEHFLDVSAWSVPDIAGKIAADGIHIAVNLNGYTKVLLTTSADKVSYLVCHEAKQDALLSCTSSWYGL